MAFIYKQDRSLPNMQTVTSENVGPGSYKVLEKKAPGLSYAPFGSSVLKNKQPKPKDQTPGPGEYQNSLNKYVEKVVVSSANEDIKIVEVPKQSSCFKSSTNRFPQHNQVDPSPGPASYSVDLSIGINGQQKQIVNNQTTSKKELVGTIKKINKYKSIPSIPSKIHSYGYSENKNSDLQLNKVPIKSHSGVGNDKIGPGHYSNKDQIQSDKGPEWHKYKSREQVKKAKTYSVAPGQYDIQTSYIPLYKMKESPGFISKTLRGIYQQKGQVTKQLLKQKREKELQGIGGGNNDTNANPIQKQIEDYVEDQSPAPGHYHNENAMSSLKLKNKEEKYQFFGSSADRFEQEKQLEYNIGPGQYNPKNNHLIGQTTHPIKVRNPPFLSSNTRFNVKSIIDSKPAPGQYENKNDSLEDKLIKKIQKGYRGNFGSSEQRFKVQKKTTDVPGPGQYIEPIKEIDQDEQQATYQFKSVQKRALEAKKSSNPPIGSYNVDFFDIQRKIQNQNGDEEEDPELIIKKPGFNSSAPRFGENQLQQYYDDDTQDTIQQQQQQQQQEQIQKYTREQLSNKKKQQQGIGFHAKAPRFNYKTKEKKPGPGQYNQSVDNDTWNKRTFNIMFAEI